MGFVVGALNHQLATLNRDCFPAKHGHYTLQRKNDLAGGSWVDSGYSISTANGTNSITITAPTGSLVFRLKQP